MKSTYTHNLTDLRIALLLGLCKDKRFFQQGEEPYKWYARTNPLGKSNAVYPSLPEDLKAENYLAVPESFTSREVPAYHVCPVASAQLEEIISSRGLLFDMETDVVQNGKVWYSVRIMRNGFCVTTGGSYESWRDALSIAVFRLLSMETV